MSDLHIMVRCCLPNGHLHPRTIDALEISLAATFSGFTCYPMTGHWVDPDTNNLSTELGVIYEVSFPVAPSSDHFNKALEAFRNAGQKMGETWVHLERHEFTAHHMQVNPD